MVCGIGDSDSGLLKRHAAAKTPHEKKSLETQIAATDRQIDSLVYELYGLTPEEIKIVEQASVGPAEASDAEEKGDAVEYTPYQPALDNGISEEMDRLNFRRLQFVDRKARGELTPAEELEFEQLQDKFFDYIETVFPRSRILDDDRIEKLEQKLRDAKQS